MEESSAGNMPIIYQGRTETQNIFNQLREYVINHRNSINISKLKEIEEKLRNDINKFKQSIESSHFSYTYSLYPLLGQVTSSSPAPIPIVLPSAAPVLNPSFQSSRPSEDCHFSYYQIDFI
jgi:hypothetical protein